MRNTFEILSTCTCVALSLHFSVLPYLLQEIFATRLFREFEVRTFRDT